MIKKNGAGGINLLTSDYPTKLWSSRQYGTGSKTKIQTEMEQDRKPINKPMHPWVPYFLTKEAIIYNGAKTASSINGAGKTGQLHIKE